MTSPLELMVTTPRPLLIEIMNNDGEPLLTLTVTPAGLLDVTGDPANYTEAGRRFIEGLMQMAGG